MPQPHKAFAENAPGTWYVDHECICCGLCENVAPDLFRMSADGGNYLVHLQPSSLEEISDAENARERCPAEAIGDDRPAAEMTLEPT